VRAALFVAVLAALLSVISAQAFAAQVSCGQVITQDTKVENDLIDCPDTALVIGADNITLDLGGHTTSGTTRFSDGSPPTAGVSNEGHGIEAGPNFADGGGNKARGNGNPLQCVGVVCK